MPEITGLRETFQQVLENKHEFLRDYSYRSNWDNHGLAEEVLEAGLKLIDARLRPNEGWHRKIKSEAESRYFVALNRYAAALAAGADPQVWKIHVDEARRMKSRAKV